MSSELSAAFAEHRPALLRHCYRMMGSFAEAEDLVQDALEQAWKARESYRGDAPLRHWLFRIATNACLNALARRRKRSMPQLEHAPSGEGFVLGEIEYERFITPGPDVKLFPDPAEAAESRETVALAFVALLQRVPPKQRAALLMKDVLGFPAEEIAEALELSLSSVNSALHRGRIAVAREEPVAEEPSADTLERFVRAWETHDLDALVTLLRSDITLVMPPYGTWFRGLEHVMHFFRSPRFAAFRAADVRLVPTRANGLPAFGFHRRSEDGLFRAHSVMLARFAGERAAELSVFLGDAYFAPFEFSSPGDRTISEARIV